MPKFKYTALNDAGKKTSGVLSAENKTELYEKLREEMLSLLTSEEILDKNRVYRKMPLAYLAEFCQQLSVMLSSGITLIRSLNIIAEDENMKRRYKDSCIEIIKELMSGIPLSTALEIQEGAYPDLMISMIRSAEMSGRLEDAIQNLAIYYEAQNKMNKKISGAMMYPKFLTLILIGAVVGIVSFVVPQFQGIFEMLDELPMPTKILLAFSDFIREHFFIMLFLMAVIYSAITLIAKIPALRFAIDKIKIRLPVIGKILRVIYTARFATSLNSLYSSGVVIITALQMSRKNVGNLYIDAQFDNVIQMVKQGDALSKSLATVDGFESKLASIITVGEESGMLGEMLRSIAVRYEYDTEIAVDKLVKLIEPAMIVVMALVIGFIMIAVMMPIVETYDAIEQSASY